MTKQFKELFFNSEISLAKEVLPLLAVKGVKTKKMSPKISMIDVGWKHPIPLSTSPYQTLQKNLLLKMEMAPKKDSFHLPQLHEHPEIKNMEALDSQIWETLQRRYENPATRYVRGRILNSIKGGYSVGIAGIIGFLPNNLSIRQKSTKRSPRRNNMLKTFYLELVDIKTKNLVVSRKHIVEQWLSKNPDWVLRKMGSQQRYE